MPRPSFSPEQSEQIRQDIIAEALELFGEDGIDQLSLRRLAERMGIAHTKIYSYFKNKDELLDSLLNEMLLILHEFLEQADNRRAKPVKRLRLAARALLEFAMDHPDYYTFMFALPIRETNSRGLSTRHTVFNHVVDIAEIAHEEGSINIEPRTLTNLSWAMLHGLITLELNDQLKEGRTLDELADAAMDILFAQ